MTSILIALGYWAAVNIAILVAGVTLAGIASALGELRKHWALRQMQRMAEVQSQREFQRAMEALVDGTPGEGR